MISKIREKISQRFSKLPNFDDIAKYEIVSFDLFDTLLKRQVIVPEDIFEVVEHMDTSRFKGFKEERIKAESKARQLQSGEEVTLKQIYNCFSLFTSEEREYLSNSEIEIEKQYLTVNKDMISLFESCIRSHKRIFLVSDMYLPKEVIMSILDREGITGYERLFLSAEIGLTKYTGSLFKYIKGSIGESTLWVHIGDSFISDYIRPKQLGIDAIHIPTYNHKVITSKKDLYNSGLKLRILYNFINNGLNRDDSPYYKFGYEKLGMFLWGYIQWLHENFNLLNLKKVYFFSRDGLIMKQAFELMYPNSTIKSQYLEVSRRSLRIPILHLDCRLESVFDMISPSEIFTLKMFFDGIGLECSNYSLLMELYGYKIDMTFRKKKALNDDRFREFYSIIEHDLIENSKEEYNLLVGYLRKFDVRGKFAIVDIGWSGGMQRYLIETLNALGVENEIIGFYTGVADYFKRNQAVVPDLNLNGYLFDFSRDSNAVDKRNSFVGLFETLFLERDGSVDGYYKGLDGIKARRSNYEYLNEDGTKSAELNAVENIQKGALEFLNDISKTSIFDSFDYSPDELFYGLSQTGNKPSKNDINLFADFRFFDEGVVNRLASPNLLFYYIVKPKKLISDFMMSRWKIGFLKRLFKIPLPYRKIYTLLYKFK